MRELQTILVKLFNRYPSMATVSDNQAKGILAAYMETLREFSSQVVSSACDSFCKNGSAFPPSADELFVECRRQRKACADREAWEAEGRRQVDFKRYRLPAPATLGFTVEQLADWSLLINHVAPYTLRVDANGRLLRIPDGNPGAGKLAEYGYLTPAETQAVKDAKPKSSRKLPEAAE